MRIQRSKASVPSSSSLLVSFANSGVGGGEVTGELRLEMAHPIQLRTKFPKCVFRMDSSREIVRIMAPASPSGITASQSLITPDQIRQTIPNPDEPSGGEQAGYKRRSIAIREERLTPTYV